MLNITPSDIKSTSSASTAPLVEAGVYPAIITLIADLGIQKDKKFESINKPDEQCTDDDYTVGHCLWYSFTLPTERYEAETDDGPEERDQILGKKFKVSKSDKSNLVQMYKSVVKDGRTFGEMLGMPVTITTGITSGGKAKVTNIAAPMKGTNVGAPLREPMLITEDDWDSLEDLQIPDFLKDMIQSRIN